MGIFDRFSALLKSNINDLISRAEDPEKMLTQILVDMRGQLVKAKQQVAAAIADEKRLRDQADAEFKQAQDWEQRAMLADPGRARRSRQAGARAPGRAHRRTAQQLEQTWEQHRARDGEAQELAARPQRQDRGGEAQEESARRPPAPRAGAEAHRRDDVVALREVARSRRSRGWKSASRRTSARSRRRPRSTRSSPATRSQRDFKQLEKGAVAVSRRQAAARAQAEDGHAARAGAQRRTRRSAPGERDEETVHAEIERPGGREEPVSDDGRRGASSSRRSSRRRSSPSCSSGCSGQVAQVFLLLFLGILISLYLGALSPGARSAGCAFPSGSRSPPRSSSRSAALALLVLDPRPAGDRADAASSSGCCRRTSAAWEAAIDRLVARVPALRVVYDAGRAQAAARASTIRSRGQFGDVVPKVFGIVDVLISIFSVAVMGIYLALHPALYREWLIALFPPIHRDLVRDVLADCADSLRAYIVGLLLTMTFLGDAHGDRAVLLHVPYCAARSASSPGSRRSCRSSARCSRRRCPRCSSSARSRRRHARACWVVVLGIVVHLIEGNVVSPLIMSKKVDLPPVLTIMSVLIIGRLLGPLGLLVAVPALAVIMVIVRRILITRIYEGQGFRRTTRERRSCCGFRRPRGASSSRRAQPWTWSRSWSGEPRPRPCRLLRSSLERAALSTIRPRMSRDLRFLILADGLFGPRQLQDRQRLHPLHAGARRRRHRRDAAGRPRRTSSDSAATSPSSPRSTRGSRSKPDRAADRHRAGRRQAAGASGS